MDRCDQSSHRVYKVVLAHDRDHSVRHEYAHDRDRSVHREHAHDRDCSVHHEHAHDDDRDHDHDHNSRHGHVLSHRDFLTRN